MIRKDVKLLERELDNLKSQLEAKSGFRYAERAEIARRAQALVHEAAALLRGNPRDTMVREIHRSAVEAFRTAVDRAYPAGFWEDVERLRRGELSGLAAGVAFLEADPWFDGSGYTKANLIRYITRIDLPHDIAERLRRVVLAAVDHRDRREFRLYCRLARKVDSVELRELLGPRLQHSDPAIRRRARWVLEASARDQVDAEVRAPDNAAPGTR